MTRREGMGCDGRHEKRKKEMRDKGGGGAQPRQVPQVIPGPILVLGLGGGNRREGR
jgi:hypothetical protein